MLPENIETQLSELEARHCRHQQMLQDHQDRKAKARIEHYARRHRNSVIPITLV